MLTLPAELLPLIVEFAPLFSKSVWERARILLIGAVLAVGKRTVTACLRVTGNSQDKRFQNDHRLLNRARWSALRAFQVMLRMLVTTFAPSGELIIGIDDTIERLLVRKTKTDLRRCDCDRKAMFVEQLPFFNVRLEQGCFKSPALFIGALN